MSWWQRIRRGLMPAAIFVGVFLVHYVWLAVFPERSAVQNQWVAVPETYGGILKRYLEGQNYWLGFSYALALAFVAASFRRYREESCCQSRNLAIGGVTFTGVLAVAGCFLLGCCGSPMLAVYVSLFGAAFAPVAKPLAAGITLLSVVGASWWAGHQRNRSARVALATGVGGGSPQRPAE